MRGRGRHSTHMHTYDVLQYAEHPHWLVVPLIINLATTDSSQNHLQINVLSQGVLKITVSVNRSLAVGDIL